jgi:hypothetical protein
MFAWSQLDFSAIPVSISAVSLTRKQTWQNVNSERRLQRTQNVQKGKRHQKKETFCFWGEFCRNFLLGNTVERK